MKRFIAELDKNGYIYKVEEGRVIISKENRNVHLDSLTTIPEGTVFENGGYVNLYSLTTLPDRIKFENGGDVHLDSLTTFSLGVVFKNGGFVDLNSLITLPEEVVFENIGGINLNSLTALPVGMKFKNGGDVHLSSLTSLPKGVRFENEGGVILDHLTTLPEGVVFENVGNIDLRSLITLPEGTVFENGGYVDLRSLTTIPNGIIFENKDSIFLPSLPFEPVVYQGKKFSVRTIDESTMLISYSRKVGEYIAHKALYFKGGDLENLPKAYIAEKDGLFAHGETIKKAVQDVEFKFRQENLDITSLVEEIKAKGFLTKEDYRLLTGACELGVKHFLREKGITGDRLSIKEVLELTKDAYGGETVRELLEVTL